VDLAHAEALVWTDHNDPAGLGELLTVHPAISWVQLPWAGVEPYLDVISQHAKRSWTCASGVYADPVAEHALALLLGGFRHLPQYARASSWGRSAGLNLIGARITVLGGGGIARSLIGLLEPFGCDVTVVRRRPEPMEGVGTVVGVEHLHDSLRDRDALVLALPLTPETVGVIGAAELALLAPHAWVVNVARGRHIDTDALVSALGDEMLGGAGLDVTDPEPLPDDHPLWAMENVIITPHTANTPAMAAPLLSRRVRENVARRIAGEALAGLVDAKLGY